MEGGTDSEGGGGDPKGLHFPAEKFRGKKGPGEEGGETPTTGLASFMYSSLPPSGEGSPTKASGKFLQKGIRKRGTLIQKKRKGCADKRDDPKKPGNTYDKKGRSGRRGRQPKGEEKGTGKTL